MRKLTLEGKVVIFKTIAISEIVFQSFVTTVPKDIVNELEKIQKTFFWNNSSPKIRLETFLMTIKMEGKKMLIFETKLLLFNAPR